MSEKDKANLLAILDCCTKIQKFTSDTTDADAFFADEKTFDAVLMNFVIIGESVARLSEDFKENEPQTPWIQIKGFRNMVAHEYFGVDAEEVWQIVHQHLPTLASQIRKILNINS